MPQLTYWRSTTLHLELAHFYNAGLTIQEIKECVNQLEDFGSSTNTRLWMDGNTVRTFTTNPDVCEEIVWYIEDNLNLLIKKKNE